MAPRGALRQRRRLAIEALIERAIVALDALDGDLDLEPSVDDEEDNVASCAAHDDDPSWFAGHMHALGDETDAEDGGDLEPDDDDMNAVCDEEEPNFPHRRARAMSSGRAAA